MMTRSHINCGACLWTKEKMLDVGKEEGSVNERSKDSQQSIG